MALTISYKLLLKIKNENLNEGVGEEMLRGINLKPLLQLRIADTIL